MALMVGNKTIVLEEDERQREALKDPFRKPRTWGPLGNLFADLVLLLDVSRSLSWSLIFLLSSCHLLSERVSDSYFYRSSV